MIRVAPFACLLLLATSCLPRAETWRVEPVPSTAAVPDPHTSVLAVIERVVEQHGFLASGGTPGCTREWRRTVSRNARFGASLADATVCADYSIAGVITVRLVERIPANQAWSAAADSLRTALTDSLAPWGGRAGRDR